MIRYAITLLGLLLMCSPASSESIQPGTHPLTFEATWDGSVEPFNLHVPRSHDGETPLPLAVVLHGKGATWESWFAATDIREWGEEHGMVVVAPHGRGNWFYLGPGEQDVLDVIAEVKRLCRIDEERVYLMGHSMGGWGTWHLGASHPDLFAAIVPMATWPPVEQLPNVRNLAPMVIHGLKDDVVTPEWSDLAVRHLENLDIEHAYIQDPDAGHESAMINRMLPRIAEWVKDRRRVKDPQQVQVRAFSPRRGQNAWVSLHEAMDFTKVAKIDAVANRGRIDIVTENVRDFALRVPPQALIEDISLELSIDNQVQRVSIPPEDRVIVLKWSARGWMPRLAPVSSFDAPKPKVVGTVEYEANDLPAIIGRIIALQVDVDVVLLPKDLVAPTLPPGGKITEDTVLDLFLRPEDEMCRVDLSREEYEELIVGREWYPSWWGELSVATRDKDWTAGETIRVAMPRVLALRMPGEELNLGVTFRKIVYDHLRRHATFVLY